MPQRRLRRFTQLEQARPSRPEEAALPSLPATEATDAKAAAPGRFAGLDVEPSSPDTRSPSLPAVDARFAPPPPPSEAPTTGTLELATRDPDAQPFLRCCLCHVDSTRDASSCRGCSAPLDTPEQQSFNRAHWAELRASRDAHEQQLAGDKQTELERAQAAARENRAVYEGMARELGERERLRLGREGLFTGHRHIPGGLRIRLVAVALALLFTFGARACGVRGPRASSDRLGSGTSRMPASGW